MAGNEHLFYPYVMDSDWIGGDSAYSSLEEAGSYWFNGMIPNAVLSDNDEILQKTKDFMDYVLEHQGDDGWLGPEANNNRTRYLWGRYPFFFGAIQLLEVFPEYTDPFVSAMYKFVPLANQMLRDGEGLEIWTNTRWEDFVMVLEWLYDYHPEGQEELLLDTIVRLRASGVPWEEVYKEENFPKIEVDNLENPTGYVLSWHGVNFAEGMKALPAMYRVTANQSELDSISHAWDMLFEYHGRPSGMYSCDEYLAGKEATRGTELCTVVETMYSANYLYQITADAKYIDRAERVAYNALPAELTGDMWHRQYNQQQNQVASKNMTPNPFYVDGPYANVFGLEPYYPCCTVNHPQGFPKFVSHSFLKDVDETALVQVYHGPLTLSTTLGDNTISITSDTTYPFSDSIALTVDASAPFAYYIRVPEWVVNGTVATNGGAAEAIQASSGLMKVDIPEGKTTLNLMFPAEITTEDRLHGAVAVHRGPLHYAYDITYNTTTIQTLFPAEPRASDLQLDATGTWNYAIDPSTLKFVSEESASDLPSPIFDSNVPPVHITVQACPIEWGTAGDTFAAPPPENPECIGDAVELKLQPYGGLTSADRKCNQATKLRISEFPVRAHGILKTR
ncbi:hypothetical protein GGG16DRAFT_51912 [Schizophyllum commune]